MRHEVVEWDSDKAAKNYAKHRVRFEEAAKVLCDPFWERFHVQEYDTEHSTSDEDRWKTAGTHPERREMLLVISWTQRLELDGRSVTRIISARRATIGERKAYEDKVRKI